MRILGLALVALLAAASGFLVYSRVNKSSSPSIKLLERYNRWKLKFGKLHATPAENGYRLAIFAKSAKAIDEDNVYYSKWALENGYGVLESPMFALQAHSDLTAEEFKQKYLGLDITMAKKVELSELPQDLELPEQNLAQTAYVAKVREQHECGSCWAFSTVATLEKQYFDKYRVQVDLSQQDILDCSTEDNGCDGGWPANTYYHVSNNGIAMSVDYPYEAVEGKCRKTNTLRSGRTTINSEITSKTLNFNIPTAQSFAKMGIIAGIAIASSGRFARADFTNNKIFDPNAFRGECTQTVDHAVNLGDANAEYITIHNSWGLTWGTNGRGRLVPCKNGLLGSPAYITHTYSKLPYA
jgi:Papain family cysteine protease